MRVGIAGLGRIGFTLGMVLQEYGGHQVIGWDPNAQTIRDRQEIYVNNESIHPDPELRYLLKEARPLALAPSLEHLVEHSDVVYFMRTAREPFSRIRQMVAATNSMMDAFAGRRYILVLGQLTVDIPKVSPRPMLAPYGRQWAYNPICGPHNHLVQDLVEPDRVWIGADEPAVAQVLVDIWTPVVNTRPYTINTPEGIENAHREWAAARAYGYREMT